MKCLCLKPEKRQNITIYSWLSVLTIILILLSSPSSCLQLSQVHEENSPVSVELKPNHSKPISLCWKKRKKNELKKAASDHCSEVLEARNIIVKIKKRKGKPGCNYQLLATFLGSNASISLGWVSRGCFVSPEIDSNARCEQRLLRRKTKCLWVVINIIVVIFVVNFSSAPTCYGARVASPHVDLRLGSRMQSVSFFFWKVLFISYYTDTCTQQWLTGV